MAGHLVSFRHQPQVWLEDGRFRGDSLDLVMFEVNCQTCGDAGGPYEQQPAHIQKIRGPYRGEAAAKAAATKHMFETS
jgi:hypothetical protein